MSLVVLLILSEDDVWCNQINQIEITSDVKERVPQTGEFSLIRVFLITSKFLSFVTLDNYIFIIIELFEPLLKFYYEKQAGLVNLDNITLGSLIILVIVRTIQYNLSRVKDKYLHTNCLATLANMSSRYV